MARLRGGGSFGGFALWIEGGDSQDSYSVGRNTRLGTTVRREKCGDIGYGDGGRGG